MLRRRRLGEHRQVDRADVERLAADRRVGQQVLDQRHPAVRGPPDPVQPLPGRGRVERPSSSSSVTSSAYMLITASGERRSWAAIAANACRSSLVWRSCVVGALALGDVAQERVEAASSRLGDLPHGDLDRERRPDLCLAGTSTTLPRIEGTPCLVAREPGRVRVRHLRRDDQLLEQPADRLVAVQPNIDVAAMFHSVTLPSGRPPTYASPPCRGRAEGGPVRTVLGSSVDAANCPPGPACPCQPGAAPRTGARTFADQSGIPGVRTRPFCAERPTRFQDPVRAGCAG